MSIPKNVLTVSRLCPPLRRDLSYLLQSTERQITRDFVKKEGANLEKQYTTPNTPEIPHVGGRIESY